MAELTVKNQKGDAVSSLRVDDSAVRSEASDHLLWEVVTAHLANRRAGTHKTKSRGEVAGSGKKLWKQKHTGRARMGSIRSPLWRHGGTVHGPVPRDHGKDVPARKRTVALRRALSDLLREERVTVVDSLELGSPKTKEFSRVLGALRVAGRALVVDAEGNRNLLLAGRNLPKVEVRRVQDLHAYELLLADTLVISEGAMKRLAERLQA
jgi:large subunit ribosomal protein L4